MPRIYDSRSDPHDFCRRCFPEEGEASTKFEHLGDGPDGRGNCYSYDDSHPPYCETDYRCETCNAPLMSLDDFHTRFWS